MLLLTVLSPVAAPLSTAVFLGVFVVAVLAAAEAYRSHSANDSIACAIFSTAMAICIGSLVSVAFLSMEATILYFCLFGSNPYHTCYQLSWNPPLAIP
ncbi:hypothetical protein [Argonema antarcticum]|uniref:hypothetical protein n=1 Tax=Argonema antarcticum TaxID=2942763 RepID=UPI0020110EE3|nr:hypothetical protein [Argonema antarcticum]